MFEFWFQIPKQDMYTVQHLLWAAHIAPDFTCVHCTDAGTIFGTTDVYELGLTYLSISIFS